MARHLLPLLLLAAVGLSEGSVQFHVSLRVPRFVEMGGSVLLFCEHSVAREQLHKIEWLRDGRKLFQFVRGRQPPYRNFTTPGAQLDWRHSNERQVMLRNLQFEASGFYSCEVSTETPIYTKASNDQQLTVLLKQRAEPHITGRKPGLYLPGEKLELNCTASPSRPEADITWIVNGKKVDDRLLQVFPGQRTFADLTFSTVQLSLELSEDNVIPAPSVAPGAPPASGLVQLTCLTTIPAFHGFEDEHENHLRPSSVRYADKQMASLTVEVMAPQPSPDPEAAATMNSSASALAASMATFVAAVLAVGGR
ncbi:uncharacterized protein LOC135937414 isoform X1 [Cloeon dipterum]|uniref:uncharacterized protein LOC135937414 isoform X1 n=1 Tax=Cloeon dipterum TaxID=197152 RepID=UPI0032206392